MYNQIYNLIKKYNTIIIHRHEKPDGDALGSQIGLKLAILETFPNKNVFVVGDTSEYLKFMGKMDEISDETYKGALAIVVDSGAEMLISDSRYKFAEKIIKIDHHIPQGEYGDVQLVNTHFESCAGLIAYLIKNTKMKINSTIATLLYTGIVTDSGRFRYGSTTYKTFDVASFLMHHNVDTEYIYTNLYTDSLSNVLLKARMTLKYEILDCGLAYIKNTYKEVQETGMNPYAFARSIINNMSGIREIKVWATFTELEDGKVILELRSSNLNVNSVATKFGGGGHINASGATVKDWSVVDSVIDELNKLISEE